MKFCVCNFCVFIIESNKKAANSLALIKQNELRASENDAKNDEDFYHTEKREEQKNKQFLCRF